MPRIRQLKSRSGRVGLDIGSHSIKGVEVVERDHEMVVRAVGCVNLPAKTKQDAPDHGAIVQAIKTLWSTAKFSSRRVALALMPDEVYTKWLHLEAPSREELDTIARAAAMRGAPFSAENAVVEYRVLTARGTTSRNVYFCMLVAGSGDAVDNLLDIAEGAGLEPEAVDITATAVMRSFESQRTGNQLWRGQPLAHIMVGARRTTMLVIRGSEVEFARTVPVGGSDFTTCIAEHCGTTAEEAEKIKVTPGTRLIDGGSLLAFRGGEQLTVPCENVVGRLSREIRRSMKFFTSQFAEGSYLGMMGAATLSGGGALLKGLDSCLQQQGVETTGFINPFAGLSVEAQGSGMHEAAENATQYAAAVGLAMGCWEEDTRPPITVLEGAA